MSRLFLGCILSLCFITAQAQIHFEKGYIINLNGEKIECFIKNFDWKNNPRKITIRHEKDGKETYKSIDEIIGFGVYEKLKYVRKEVQIDRSTTNVNLMSESNLPKFNDEILFLKVVTDGDITLYEYIEGNLTRFFIEKKDAYVEQLVHKPYKLNDYKIAYNNWYKQQLKNMLSCESFSDKSFSNLNYKYSDLKAIVEEHNHCGEKIVQQKNQEERKGDFKLSLRVGANISRLTLEHDFYRDVNVDFGQQTSLRLGIETEYVFPFNKNKWSLLLEPTYQSYSSKKTLATQDVSVDYSSIEFPLSIRHYFYINDDSKLFINASFIYELALNSIIDYEESYDLDILPTSKFAFGGGYNFKDTVSLEIRYHVTSSLTARYFSWISRYDTTSIILGYTLF